MCVSLLPTGPGACMLSAAGQVRYRCGSADVRRDAQSAAWRVQRRGVPDTCVGCAGHLLVQTVHCRQSARVATIHATHHE